MTRGGKNLVALGIISVIVAIATTSVSLAVYHNSGDIYLDRSRPGFLPDEEEISEEEIIDDEYEFDKNGEVTKETLEEYIEKLEAEVRALDAYSEAFSEWALSDEGLGILDEM